MILLNTRGLVFITLSGVLLKPLEQVRKLGIATTEGSMAAPTYCSFNTRYYAIFSDLKTKANETQWQKIVTTCIFCLHWGVMLSCNIIKTMSLCNVNTISISMQKCKQKRPGEYIVIFLTVLNHQINQDIHENQEINNIRKQLHCVFI